MEYQKATNLLGTTSDSVSRFITEKWIEVHDQSGNTVDRYKPSKPIIFKTSMLGSDFCDFSDAYIAVKGTITLTKTNWRRIIDRRNKVLAFKNNVPFTNCISKINNVFIDNAEDLDVVMPMYNLIKYSKNYKKTTGSFWNYYKDEPNYFPANNNHAISITNFESLKYKSSITGKNLKCKSRKRWKHWARKLWNLEIVVSLKHLSSFGKTLDMPLINCGVSLVLTWSENCVLTDITTQAARNTNPNADPLVQARERTDAPRGANFK